MTKGIEPFVLRRGDQTSYPTAPGVIMSCAHPPPSLKRVNIKCVQEPEFQGR
jgi:hypothetical protein